MESNEIYQEICNTPSCLIPAVAKSPALIDEAISSRIGLSQYDAIMSRFTNDVDNIQLMLEQTIVQFVSSVFSFVSIVAMMIVLEWRLFIVAFVFLIIMVINST